MNTLVMTEVKGRRSPLTPSDPAPLANSFISILGSTVNIQLRPPLTLEKLPSLKSRNSLLYLPLPARKVALLRRIIDGAVLLADELGALPGLVPPLPLVLVLSSVPILRHLLLRLGVITKGILPHPFACPAVLPSRGLRNAFPP